MQLLQAAGYYVEDMDFCLLVMDKHYYDSNFLFFQTNHSHTRY
jgi:hypothetical protein